MEPEVKIEYGDSGRFVVLLDSSCWLVWLGFFVGLGPYLDCKEQIEAEFLSGLLLAWTLGLNLKGGKQKFKRKKTKTREPSRHLPG